MPRLHVLHTRREFRGLALDGRGLRVLTNVSFDGGEPETVRISLDTNDSYRRAGNPERVFFNRDRPPFALLTPSVLMTASQLRALQDNFALVHQAIGENRLTKLSIEDAVAHDEILPRIQAAALEMIWIDEVLDQRSMSTALYQSYLQHPRSILLVDGNQLSASGHNMLAAFDEASAVYATVPELRSYLDQNDTRHGELGPRGEQFRQWLEGKKAISSNDGMTLEFVAYALRPMRMTGGDLFRWKLDAQDPADVAGDDRDIRRLTADLLLRFEGQPVWCEFKAKGDTWTSSALQQILLYGSMLCSGNQVRRCRREYSDQFRAYRPWLGIVVEERDDTLFLQDFDQALSLVRWPEVGSRLGDHFGGFVFAQVREKDSSWTIVRSEVVRW